LGQPGYMNKRLHYLHPLGYNFLCNSITSEDLSQAVPTPATTLHSIALGQVDSVFNKSLPTSSVILLSENSSVNTQHQRGHSNGRLIS